MFKALPTRMSCNIDFVAEREAISWLKDVINLDDIQFDTNYTEDTPVDETEETVHFFMFKANLHLAAVGKSRKSSLIKHVSVTRTNTDGNP